jgi:hypothetical protein
MFMCVFADRATTHQTKGSNQQVGPERDAGKGKGLKWEESGGGVKREAGCRTEKEGRRARGGRSRRESRHGEEGKGGGGKEGRGELDEGHLKREADSEGRREGEGLDQVLGGSEGRGRDKGDSVRRQTMRSCSRDGRGGGSREGGRRGTKRKAAGGRELVERAEGRCLETHAQVAQKANKEGGEGGGLEQGQQGQQGQQQQQQQQQQLKLPGSPAKQHSQSPRSHAKKRKQRHPDHPRPSRHLHANAPSTSPAPFCYSHTPAQPPPFTPPVAPPPGAPPAPLTTSLLPCTHANPSLPFSSDQHSRLKARLPHMFHSTPLPPSHTHSTTTNPLLSNLPSRKSTSAIVCGGGGGSAAAQQQQPVRASPPLHVQAAAAQLDQVCSARSGMLS